MQTELARSLGIEFPIFAFSHTRDVVVEVSKAGGFGVLGAVGFTPEQLATELEWIDAHIGDAPYGVDIVIPGKYEGMGELDPGKLEKMLADMIPDEHRRFAAKLLSDHGVPEMPGDVENRELIGWTEATATPQVLEALKHPNVKLIANALGTPPPEIIDEIHESGRLVAALCGSAHQAAKHRDGGVDIIIAQGTEGGGHTGEVGSMVLWPEVIDEVAPLPMLAAGGVGSGRQMAAALA
ncbi:MAG TPA: nitronate monooxygenase, partial [Acidimicrobiales bacterium]|nr:nitronate monooxygenase [Acidimicrobiales bacterium]